MNSPTKVIVSVAVAAVSLALVANETTASRPSRRDPAETDAQPGASAHPRHKVGGVHARDADKANAIGRGVSGAWIPGYEHIVEGLDDAPPLWDAMLEDDRWVGTSVALQVPEPGSESAWAELRCREHHLSGFRGTCDQDVRLGIAPTDEGRGKIVAARGASVGQPMACEAYHSCLVEDAWLGREVPIPSGTDTPLHVSWQNTFASFGAEHAVYLDNVRDALEALPDRIAAADHLELTDATAAFKQRRLRGMLEYYTWLYAQFEA